MRKLIFLIIVIPTIGFSQGKLSQAKGQLSSRSSNSNSNSTNDSATEAESNSENILKEAVTEILLLISFKIVLGDMKARYFSPYPYYFDNVKGEYDFGFEKGDKRSLVNLDVNYLLDNFSNSLEVGLNYRFIPILGVDLSHQSFFEHELGGTDYLDVTSLMLNYYRFRERSFTGWFGMGATYVGNEVKTFGFAYNLGLDVYLINPISASFAYKQSFINSSQINTVKYQLKYHLKRWAFYLGYHHTSLGGVRVSGVVTGIQARI
ncbi:hypothetical protein [Winogradskyella aurantiaca]|uniref:hypothetical protein n=1 Tax=Winogradskyella aurantiaca TaxID=2219558 RepID=UPI000E1CF3DF|nr:hypothetical protein [Winogradskyella aurantiaca]